MVSFDPSRPDFKPYGFTCVRWNPSPMRRPDHHNEVELNFLESGWVTYFFGGRKIRFDAGRLSVFWAAIPHQIVEFGPSTEYFVATIPFAWFLQSKLPDGFVQPLLRGHVHQEPSDARARSDRELFLQWEADLKQPLKETKDIVILEMQARLLRLSTALPSEAKPTVKSRRRPLAFDDVGLNKVEQMACLVARQYTEAMTVEEIGRAVGLHPNYVAGYVIDSAPRALRRYSGARSSSGITSERLTVSSTIEEVTSRTPATRSRRRMVKSDRASMSRTMTCNRKSISPVMV